MQQNIRLPLVLQSIYVRSSQTRIREDFNPLTPGQTLSAQILQRPEAAPGLITYKPEGGIFSYTLASHFEFRYSDKEVDKAVDQPVSDADTCAYVAADIAVVYILLGEPPSEQELSDWYQGATILHVWPYWREFCSSALSRMNLPVTMIPLLDIRRPEQEVGDLKDDIAKPSKTSTGKRRLKK